MSDYSSETIDTAKNIEYYLNPLSVKRDLHKRHIWFCWKTKKKERKLQKSVHNIDIREGINAIYGIPKVLEINLTTNGFEFDSEFFLQITVFRFHMRICTQQTWLYKSVVLCVCHQRLLRLFPEELNKNISQKRPMDKSLVQEFITNYSQSVVQFIKKIIILNSLNNKAIFSKLRILAAYRRNKNLNIC